MRGAIDTSFDSPIAYYLHSPSHSLLLSCPALWHFLVADVEPAVRALHHLLLFHYGEFWILPRLVDPPQAAAVRASPLGLEFSQGALALSTIQLPHKLELERFKARQKSQ